MKQLMILGTFHMESQEDVHNLEGFSASEHEAELEALTDRLAEYKPTKIFVEWPKSMQERLDRGYGLWNDGKLKNSDERMQIGFRLAKKADCGVYAIDWMEQGAATRGCGDVIEYMDKEPELKAEIEQYNDSSFFSVLEDGSVVEFLRIINAPEMSEKMRAYYTNFARIGVNDDYYGMGWLIWWYQRNLIIFGNISDALEDGDRALLLIGGAHKGILEEIFADSKSVEIVDSMKYLY